MIYLAMRGFSLLELGLLEGLYHITSFLMEVPTGVVADLWGRKTSRLLGRCIAACSLAIMFYSQSFALQSVAFIATALGNNLESGAGDALVYDSLLLDNREERYMHVAGRQELVYQLSAITAFVLGGYMAVHSYGLLFGLSIVCSLVAALVASGFIEPQIERTDQYARRYSLFRAIQRSVYTQVTESYHIVKNQKKILYLIVFSEIMFCFITVLFFYLQNYWKSQGFSEFYIGLFFALHAIGAGITAYHAPRVEQRLGERGVLTWMPVLLIVGLWGIALSPVSYLFYILLGCIEGVLITAVGTYINRLLPSAQRATILSFQSMVFSFFMIILFPIVGFIGDTILRPNLGQEESKRYE
jgi:MFS family permease